MLINNHTTDQVEDIVKLAMVILLYQLVGYEMLSKQEKQMLSSLGFLTHARPLMDSLYILIRNSPEIGYPKNLKFGELLDQIHPHEQLPAFTDSQLTTLTNVKMQIKQAFRSQANAITSIIVGELLKLNEDHKNEVLAHPPKISDHVEKLKNKAVVKIKETVMTNSTFKSAFTTALTTFVNQSILDKVTGIGMIAGAIDSLDCYKIVMNDERLCPWCHGFYVNKNGTPKIYKLTELIANGSNIGKLKSEWLPVIGAVHQNCRCELKIIPRSDE